MDDKEYYEFAEQFCNESRELSKRKNNDYADPTSKKDDPFAVWANFVACERLGICSTEKGMLVRMLDKLVRISNLVREGHEQKVDDEAVEDTLRDLHNYAELMAGFLKTVKKYGRPMGI